MDTMFWICFWVVVVCMIISVPLALDQLDYQCKKWLGVVKEPYKTSTVEQLIILVVSLSILIMLGIAAYKLI